MSTNASSIRPGCSRPSFLPLGALGLSGLAGGIGRAAQPRPKPDRAARPEKARPTRFLLACMTLPYSAFPLDRALKGIKAAGFDHVAWGTTHKEDGKDVPVLAA